MSLRVIEGGAAPDPERGPQSRDPKSQTSRSTAPPPRPRGTIPLALAQGFEAGEPVIWWGEKTKMNWRPVGVMVLAGVAVILGITLFAPEFWAQPWRDWAKTVAAMQLPAVAIAIREFKSRRAVAITDKAVVDLAPNGSRDRLTFRTVRSVRRDWLSGGVRLIGQRHEVRIPPALMEEARAAIASQMAHVLDFGSEGPDDRLAWFPWPGRL